MCPYRSSSNDVPTFPQHKIKEVGAVRGLIVGVSTGDEMISPPADQFHQITAIGVARRAKCAVEEVDDGASDILAACIDEEMVNYV